MNSLSNAPFEFLVRPVTTVNVSNKNLANSFEDEVRSSLVNVKFLSPISAILVLPGIIDGSVAVPPDDYVGYKKRDNSVSVGIGIDFTLWQRSSELEKIALLADNIRDALSKIQRRYLVDEDRERLHLIVYKVQALLASRLLN
jgi:hypothetical protein